MVRFSCKGEIPPRREVNYIRERLYANSIFPSHMRNFVKLKLTRFARGQLRPSRHQPVFAAPGRSEPAKPLSSLSKQKTSPDSHVHAQIFHELAVIVLNTARFFDRTMQAQANKMSFRARGELNSLSSYMQTPLLNSVEKRINFMVKPTRGPIFSPGHLMPFKESFNVSSGVRNLFIVQDLIIRG